MKWLTRVSDGVIETTWLESTRLKHIDWGCRIAEALLEKATRAPGLKRWFLMKLILLHIRMIRRQQRRLEHDLTGGTGFKEQLRQAEQCHAEIEQIARKLNEPSLDESTKRALFRRIDELSKVIEAGCQAYGITSRWVERVVEDEPGGERS